ncbi:glycine cleavage system aminomethyltransferase GcvT [bacterium]|nr:glycine cleavage system aminomethyltransferase GcvT [bacterium]
MEKGGDECVAENSMFEKVKAEKVQFYLEREETVESKKTVLYDEHLRLGGKMSDFAGWIMPLWYHTGQSIEHHTTRKAVGLFDICHMGEFEITGPGSNDFVIKMLSNKVRKLKDGRAMYNFLLNEKGGVIDDCIIYRFREDKWMLVVNAGTIEGDFEWLKKNVPSDVNLKNISDDTAKIDVQGPDAPKLLAKLTDKDVISGLKFFRFAQDMDINGMKVLVSRTGYTGEIGFELYTDIKNAIPLWNLLLEEGKEFGILPCGLGARDTLRTESGLPLHGHELHPDRVAIGHPWEFTLNFDHDFIGRDAILEAKERGDYSHVYGFVLDGRRKAMPGYKVYHNEEEAGTVLSGVISPTLDNKPIGFILVNKAMEPETKLEFKRDENQPPLSGTVKETPLVPGTSREKMENFI